MVNVIMKESSGFELHEEQEWYEGTVVDIEDLPDGKFGPGLKWIINLDGEVDEINGDPRDTWGFCSQNLSPKSRLYKWAKGILGEAAMPQPGETFDLSALVGRRVKVMFERYEGFDSDGKQVTKEKLVSMKAAGPVAAAPATPAPEPAPAPAAPATPPPPADPDPY